MSRATKRRPSEIRPTRAKRATVRRADPAASGGDALLTEGQVTGVGARGLVQAVLAGGRTVEARCPAHIDQAWLEAAVGVAPVEAVFAAARPSGRLWLWGIFPGVAHAHVTADVTIRARRMTVHADAVEIGSDKARLRLDADGSAVLKGRDVTTHARRVNRIRGGSVRLN